jgi:hypothetical protein
VAGAGDFRGAGERGGAGAAQNRFNDPSRGDLNNFLGLPSDEGMPRNNSATGAQGAAAGAAIANRNQPQYSGAQGAAAGAAVANRNQPQYSGAQGAAAGYAAGQYSTASGRYNTAAAVRTGFNGYGAYNQGWYANNPGAWAAAGWGAGNAWRAATWNSVGSWMGYAQPAPVYYDYGNNVTYQDNSVYVNGESAGTSADYYNQAAQLATTGTQADAPADSGDWLPLGVFALSKSDHPTNNLVIQLAVNKSGVIRGNYTDTATNHTQPVHGSVDKQSQRVAFTIGDNTTTVVETGLYNLTKDEAPALMHMGADRTEQWLLVRMQNQESGTGQ